VNTPDEPVLERVMSRVYYYLSPNGSKWKVTADGHPGKQWDYETKQAALNATVAAANATWSKGVKCGIRVQLANGQWQEERTYGDDPFPPRG